MFNLTNPFRRADKHGAPDMRVTAPASAEMPMMHPGRGNRPITLPSATVPAEPPGVDQIADDIQREVLLLAPRVPTKAEYDEIVHRVAKRHGRVVSHIGYDTDGGNVVVVDQGIDFHGRETGIARD